MGNSLHYSAWKSHRQRSPGMQSMDHKELHMTGATEHSTLHLRLKKKKKKKKVYYQKKGAKKSV